MNNKKGFAAVYALLVLVGVLIAVGFWADAMHQSGATATIGEQAATVSYTNANSQSTSTPILAVLLDPASPVANAVAMGTPHVPLAVFKFSNVSTQAIVITDLKVFENQNATGQKQNYSNLQISTGTVVLSVAGTPMLSMQSSTPGPGYIYAFHFPSSVIVPVGGALSLTVTGDLASYISQGATDGSIDRFEIATSSDLWNTTPELTVMAYGMVTNQTSTITLHSPVGNKQEALRSVMTVATAPLGGSMHAKSVVDNLGTITIAANPAGPVGLTKVVVRFASDSPTSTFVSTAQLIDQNGMSVVTGDGATFTSSAACAPGKQCTAMWRFPGQGFALANGSSYTFTLRINSTVIPPIPNVAESLIANIQATSSVTYKDGLDSSVITADLPPSAVPMNINSISYPPGN